MKLVSAVPLDEGQRARLCELVPGLQIADSASYISDEIGHLIDADTEILYAFRAPNDLMQRAPGFRWFQLLGAGCEHLAGCDIMHSSAVITTGSGIGATPIAEYVLGVMLAHYRWLPQAYRAQMQREWLTQADVARASRELRRRTVGIIGYGSIGREVARLAKPFGTHILALKRDPRTRAETGYAVADTGDPAGDIPEKFFGPDELLTMLPECDVVVLAVPHTEETHGLMGSREFAAMKPGSFLVNIARGSVIDEEALMAALKDGPMAGAALDVFEHEPLPKESPLWDFENLLVTPHISGASRAHLRRAFELFMENLRRFTSDQPLLNLVDKERGY